MPLNCDVKAQLRALAYDAAEQSEELPIALESLMAAALLAVPSATAVTVSSGDADPRVTVLATAREPNSPAAGSTALRLRLPGSDGAAVTVFAQQAGALDQLAADLPALLDVHRREAVLVTDLHPPTIAENSADTSAALADTSAVDRALGVLLERGLPLNSGRAQLLDLASTDGTTRADAARRVLAEIRTATDPEPHQG